MHYGCRYYEHKKSAFKKEQKTIAASEKVFFLQTYTLNVQYHVQSLM